MREIRGLVARTVVFCKTKEVFVSGFSFLPFECLDHNPALSISLCLKLGVEHVVVVLPKVLCRTISFTPQ